MAARRPARYRRAVSEHFCESFSTASRYARTYICVRVCLSTMQGIHVYARCVCVRVSITQGIDLPSDLVEGTAQGLHGAGASLLEHLYTLFTGKK